MNLKEQLAEIKSNLEDLRPQVESGDAEAIKSACELSDRYEEVEKLVKDAARFDSLMGRLGKGGELPPAGADEPHFKTMGDKIAWQVKKSGIGPEVRGTATITWDGKAASDVNKVNFDDNPYSVLLEELRPDLVTGPRRTLTIADLFASEPTTKNAITYFVEGTVEGGPDVRSEGNAYSQMHVGDPTKRTDPIKDIGTFWKDTKELLEDLPRLAANINERADYLMDIKEEDELFAGAGTGDHIEGLMNRSGLQKVYYDPTSSLDLILKVKSAKKLVKTATGFRADGLVVSDNDWDDITSLRDKNDRFLAGGPFYGIGGSAQIAEEPPLWGLRSVPSGATKDGQLVVGAWRLGGSVLRKGGRKLEITNSDTDDFQKGRITSLISEQLGLAVRYPSAFVVLKAATFTACKSTDTATAAGVYYKRTGASGAYVYTPVAVASGASLDGYYAATEI